MHYGWNPTTMSAAVTLVNPSSDNVQTIQSVDITTGTLRLGKMEVYTSRMKM